MADPRLRSADPVDNYRATQQVRREQEAQPPPQEGVESFGLGDPRDPLQAITLLFAPYIQQAIRQMLANPQMLSALQRPGSFLRNERGGMGDYKQEFLKRGGVPAGEGEAIRGRSPQEFREGIQHARHAAARGPYRGYEHLTPEETQILHEEMRRNLIHPTTKLSPEDEAIRDTLAREIHAGYRRLPDGRWSLPGGAEPPLDPEWQAEQRAVEKAVEDYVESLADKPLPRDAQQLSVEEINKQQLQHFPFDDFFRRR